MNPPIRVLYIDDHHRDRELVKEALEKEPGGFLVTEAASLAELHIRLAEGNCDAVVSDFNVFGFHGLQVIDVVKEKNPNVPVIIVTDSGSEEIAVEAMKRGAADYIIKTPSHMQRLPQSVREAIEKHRLEKQQRDEEALPASDRGYRELVQNANSIILRVDPSGRITFMNEFGLKFFGFSEEELLGRPAIGTIVPDRESSGRDLTVMVEDLMRSPEKYINNENENIRKTGETVWIAWTNRGIFDENGGLLEILCVGNDATQRRRAEVERDRLEKQLRQAQKMEALGTLAGGIAHDFNNILAAIIGFTELALLDARKPGILRSNLQQVLSSAKRARDLVQQILAFSRYNEQELKPIQMSLVVREALRLVRASLPSTIELKQYLGCTELVFGDPTQIHQVLMNLCANAAYAMKETGGVLEVRLTAVDLDQSAVAGLVGLRPGPHIRLTVADTGQGIRPEILDKIFDPFFTTKAAGQGTGLGLSVVHGIVKSHRGAIKVYSEPGKGTVFHVLLPAIEKAAPEDAPEPAPLPVGTERILVVDDEPALALMVKQMLEHLGYKAVVCGSGLEALEAFINQASGDPFDLVITDLTMPHLSGLQLAKELQRVQPDLPIILCTGFSEIGIEQKVREAGIQGFLMKPVIMRDLATIVRRILDQELSRDQQNSTMN